MKTRYIPLFLFVAILENDNKRTPVYIKMKNSFKQNKSAPLIILNHVHKKKSNP